MNVTDARDAIVATARSALPADPFHITYQDLPGVTASEWARVTVRMVDRMQRGHGDNRKKYIQTGILCIEVFTPPGDGNTRSDAIVGPALRIIEEANVSGVWYRNIRSVDIGQDGGYTKTNIYADFEIEDVH